MVFGSFYSSKLRDGPSIKLRFSTGSILALRATRPDTAGPGIRGRRKASYADELKAEPHRKPAMGVEVEGPRSYENIDALHHDGHMIALARSDRGRSNGGRTEIIS